MTKEDWPVYKTSLVRKEDNKVYFRLTTDLPPTVEDEEELLKSFPECYVDVCRMVENPLSDTANFRDEVNFDLED